MLNVDAIFAKQPGRVCYYQTKKKIMYILHARFFFACDSRHGTCQKIFWDRSFWGKKLRHSFVIAKTYIVSDYIYTVSTGHRAVSEVSDLLIECTTYQVVVWKLMTPGKKFTNGSRNSSDKFQLCFTLFRQFLKSCFHYFLLKLCLCDILFGFSYMKLIQVGWLLVLYKSKKIITGRTAYDGTCKTDNLWD